jgi:hypothetical protein
LKTSLGAPRFIHGQLISFTITRHVIRSEVKGSFVSLGEPSLAERARNSQILREDFNIDFADKNIKALIDFLKTPLDLNTYVK